jgi:hypothetical protein
MNIDLHVKCLPFLPDFKERGTMYPQVLVKISNINFMKIHPLGFALFCEKRRDRYDKLEGYYPQQIFERV